MKALLILIVIGLIPYSCFSWGRAGHHIVAEIAMHYLPNEVKEKVLAELGNTSPEDAATWMDDMRVGAEYDYMKPWHYINIPKGERYTPGQSDNIITALNHAFNDIRQNRADERQRKQDIMILFHLIGDLYQPLHDGYASDKGGNTVQLNFDGNATNLHHIWDDDIISSQNITAQACLAYAASLPPSEQKAIQSGSFVNWMEESRALLPQVYDFNGHVIDNSYLQKNTAVVRDQLVKAGIRLAYVLQILFGTDNEARKTFEIGSEAVSYGIEQHEVPGNRRYDKAESGKGGTYTPEQAAQHIGEIATVCGKVYGGKYLKSSEVTFLNMGAEYPSSPFTIVIFGIDRNHFAAAPETVYNGLNVCVTGLIKEYKGKAEIIVSKEEQIQIQ